MDALETANGSVSLTFSKAEALVLFDWLHRLEEEDISSSRLDLADQAEQRVLWDISASLESVLAEPFRHDYAAIIDAAAIRCAIGRTDTELPRGVRRIGHYACVSEPTEASFDALINELTVGLGFMLSAETRARIMSSQPSSIDALTDSLLVAEGFDPPTTCDLRLRRQVRAAIKTYLGSVDA